MNILIQEIKSNDPLQLMLAGIIHSVEDLYRQKVKEDWVLVLFEVGVPL